MILHPPILALSLAATLCAVLVLWASLFAATLLRRWDLASGAQVQIDLEKRTYLVAVLLRFVMAVEIVALALFVFNADRMAAMFVGAMCAVGAFNASVFGFPALGAKIAMFFGASLWLAADVIDARGRDYPLTRRKYALLIALAPLAVADAGLTLAYFLDLKADTLTSCCGKLFSSDKPTIAAEMASLDPRLALTLLFGGLAATLATAVLAMRAKIGQALYGAASLVFFIIAIAAVISAISLYVYEHPHHHCPFCLLKRDYSYFGFVLYAPLFAGAAAGVSAGALSVLPTPDSLKASMPMALRRMILMSAAGFCVFAAAAAWAVARSGLTLIP